MFLDQTNRNFDALAEQAATQFFSKGTTLSDSIVEIATREKLNPMEIQRLVEKSNTAATLKLLSISTDKKAEFKVADYEDIINKIYPKEDTKSPAAKPEEPVKKEVSKDDEDTSATKTASYNEDRGSIPLSLPNTRRGSLKGATLPSVSLQKVASEKTPALSTQIFKLSKAIEETAQEKIACEMRIQNRAEHIVTAFSSFTAPSFSKFANEVHTIYGAIAHPLIKGIAQSLKEPVELTKIASIVDNTTKSHTLFKEAQESLHHLVDLQDKLHSQKETLANLYKQANSYVNYK